MDGMKDSWKVRNSWGCKCEISLLADGSYSVQYDEDKPCIQTAAELANVLPLPDETNKRSWTVLFELLRMHTVTAHIDTSYIELAAR